MIRFPAGGEQLARAVATKEGFVFPKARPQPGFWKPYLVVLLLYGAAVVGFIL